jgi:hypothetical protein
VLLAESAAAMVHAADLANSVDGLRIAIIGGFAVTCRLGHVHRATGDVDAVADEGVDLAANSSAQLLVEAGVADPDPTPSGRDHRVWVDGTKLEIIDTQPLTGEASDVESPLPRLFVLGHRWALDRAETIAVQVAGSAGAVVLPVALPAALVTTKLHAFCDRQAEAKRASDLYDIYRLLEAYDREGALARAVDDGPSGLAAVVREVTVSRILGAGTRAIRYLRTYGDPAWPDITQDDLQRVVGVFVDGLTA